jgi:hypothetical protein
LNCLHPRREAEAFQHNIFFQSLKHVFNIIKENKICIKIYIYKINFFLQTKPYGMLKETVSKMSGNDRYEGFAIDIIHEISKILGFNYTFSVQTDNNYGSYNRETGKWNGMMKKILDNVSI